MAELATIARPYAEALFKSKGLGAPQETADLLDSLAFIAEDVRVQQFTLNPKVSVSQVMELVASVLKIKLPQGVNNFLHTLLEHGRLSVLPEVAHQYRALLNAQSGFSEAVIYSAFPLDAAAKAAVTEVLEKRFSRQLQTSVVIDESLIGGVRVVVGDEVLDTSVKSRLEEMKVVLTS
jgi:F-type H+-transporting ATPase subunit delta